MATTTANILIGACTASSLAYATGSPTSATTYTDFGHTKGPVSYTMNKEVFEIKSERAFGTLKGVPIDGTMSVKIPVMEVIAENLRIAFSQPAANMTTSTSGVGTLNIGNLSEQYHQLKLVGPGPAGTDKMTIYLWKAMVESVAEIPIAKGDTQVIDMTFKCLYDDTATLGYFGRIVFAT